MPKQTVHTEAEIAASPEIVRSLFLNWPSYKEWHPQWTLTTQDENKKPADLAAGDTIHVDMGFSFNPVVEENTPACFSWTGNLYGMFVGTHEFRFNSSEKTPGGTKLIQKEDFSGPLAILMGESWGFGGSSRKNFEQFNENLKKAAEKAAAEQTSK